MNESAASGRVWRIAVAVLAFLLAVATYVWTTLGRMNPAGGAVGPPLPSDGVAGWFNVANFVLPIAFIVLTAWRDRWLFPILSVATVIALPIVSDVVVGRMKAGEAHAHVAAPNGPG